MGKIVINEDTIIEIGKAIPLSSFRDFFYKKTGKELPSKEFQPWLNEQSGKTIREASEIYCQEVKPKSMEEIMLENRFKIVSDFDKDFIYSFDKEIQKFGYDFGGGIGDGFCWGKHMIIYAKTGVKKKNVIARIYIREKDICLRLYFNDIDKHRAYIENAQEHIREVFTGKHGNCSCNPKKENCRMRKSYEIDGVHMEKCNGLVFEFCNPTTEKLQDYIDLLKEFYPVKKA